MFRAPMVDLISHRFEIALHLFDANRNRGIEIEVFAMLGKDPARSRQKRPVVAAQDAYSGNEAEAHGLSFALRKPREIRKPPPIVSRSRQRNNFLPLLDTEYSCLTTLICRKEGDSKSELTRRLWAFGLWAHRFHELSAKRRAMVAAFAMRRRSSPRPSHNIAPSLYVSSPLRDCLSVFVLVSVRFRYNLGNSRGKPLRHP